MTTVCVCACMCENSLTCCIAPLRGLVLSVPWLALRVG